MGRLVRATRVNLAFCFPLVLNYLITRKFVENPEETELTQEPVFAIANSIKAKKEKTKKTTSTTKTNPMLAKKPSG